MQTFTLCSIKQVFFYKKRLLKIFIVPPSLEELRKRLINRGRDKIEDIENRLSKAELEIKQSVNYDYIIVSLLIK